MMVKLVNRKTMKKIGIVLLIMLQISMLSTLSVNALIMDGIIDEDEWTQWFTDDENPSYTTYYMEDQSNIYLGLITDTLIPDNSQLQVAFKTSEYDWAIMITETSIEYKRNKNDPRIGAKYWKAAVLGLPEGVQVVQGVTGDMISYEIAISKELIGEYGVDYPDNFTFWLMYTLEGDGSWIWSIIDIDGEVNFYPDAYAGWWFAHSLDEETEEIPLFHTPEIPYGTLMSLTIMLSVILIRHKRLTIFA
jgi:hypothetical protein